MIRMATLDHPAGAAAARSARIKTWQLYLVILALHLGAAALFQETVWTKDVYATLFSDRLEESRVNELFDQARRFTLAGYLALPLVLALRFGFVALLLQCGFLIGWKEIPFGGLFRVVAVASLTGVLALLTKVMWFLVAPPGQVTALWLAHVPFSLGQIVGLEGYTPWAQVVLQSVNGFEAGWGILVWRGTVRLAAAGRGESAAIVGLVWALTVTAQGAVAALLGAGPT
jgi:hypothetical protein